MELMNMIFENYGGQQIGRIFKNYFFLTLLLKQLMFSFFAIPALQPGIDAIPAENEIIIEDVFQEESPGEELNWIETLQLMMTLAQLETENPVSSN